MTADPVLGSHRQPPALATLVAIKTCDSFGYLGLRALLIIYLTEALHLRGSEAFGILGGFLALSYVMPVIGGVVGDRLTGHFVTCATGMILTSVGYASLTLSAVGGYALNGHRALIVGLACVAVGNGYVKSSIMTMVGGLYERNDPRRDGGFLIGYMGMNVGQLLSATFASLAVYRLGWPYGFAMLGVGSLAGFALLVYRRGLLPLECRLIRPGPTKLLSTGVASLAVCACGALLSQRTTLGWILVAAWCATWIYLAYQCRWYGNMDDQRRLRAVVILVLSAALGWMFVEQAAGSLDLLAVQHIPAHFLGLAIAPPQYQTLNPIYLIVLCPLAAGWSGRTSEQRQKPGTGGKFAGGFVFFAASFAILGAAATWCTTSQLSPWWLVICYLLSAIGEALISPVGASSMTRLSMPRTGGAVMGLWYLSFAAGDFAAQKLGALTNTDSAHAARLATYGRFFFMMAAAAGLGAVAVLSLSGILHRLQSSDDIRSAS